MLDELLSKLPKFSDDKLLVGFNNKDDAAVYRISDEMAAVQTVDFFPPVVDDPFKFGRIAAANSLSDIYAMGIHPQLAMNVFCFNSVELELEVAADILAGGADALVEAEATLVGGQTLEDDIPKYGLCVTAFVPIDSILTNSGANPGELVILTKAIGTAAIIGAMREHEVCNDALNAAVDQMSRLNKYAVEAFQGFKVSACTDVTGFGLLGHMMELAVASDVTVEIEYDAVPKLPNAEAYTIKEFAPLHKIKENLDYVEEHLDAKGVEEHKITLLAEPQTSGGLLICIKDDDAQALLERLRKRDPDSAVIGRVMQRGAHAIRVI